MRKSFQPVSIFLTSLFLLFFVACDPNRVFEKNQKIKNNEWWANDTVSFVTALTDTSLFYDILINIRNGNHYEYNNLFLFINVEAPSGNSITDTIEVALADKNGKWHGNGLGDISFLSVPYKKSVRFAMSGIYTIKIVHGMRDEKLIDVYNIGLRVQRSGPLNQGSN